MQIRTLYVAFLALFALAVSGCDQSSGTSPSSGGSSGGSSSNDSGSGDIKIGHYGSMTGSEATFGVSTDNGIRLAVKERNAAGGIKAKNGRKIALTTYDDQGKSQEVVTSVTRLIQQDKVVAVLGEVASSRSIAGGQIAQRLGVPMISPSSTNPQVTEIGDMVSRVCFIDPFQGFVGASFAKNNLKLDKAATLYNRAQAYSSGLNEEFAKAFKQLGGEVLITQAYSDGDNDFSAQLTAIRGKNPQFIYIPGYYTEVVNIARQARKLGITAPLIGGDGWVSEELKNAGDALDN
jgi:branched-chain amino acid transport system substrate-binding protein